MSELISILTSSTQPVSGHRNLLYATWTIVLLLTLPQIILGAFMNLDTEWLSPARLVLLAAVFALTFVWPLIRPLRRLTLVFLVIYGVEGWFFLTFIQKSLFFANLASGDANLVFFGERLLRIGAVLVMLLVLRGMGLRRSNFFLTVGNLTDVAEAEKWGIPRRPQTWPGFGGRYALIIVIIFIAFLIPTLQPSWNNLSVGLLLFAALCALLNAFAEEFLYRSALLPQVLPLFGKGASMFLMAGWFGIAHYFGMPYGPTGVLITFIGGWIFAKSMIETRGMGWALFLHWISDFVVYTIVFLAGGF